MTTLTSTSDYLFFFFSARTQFKRHKTKQHTRNLAKSVVNLVDAVSKPPPPFEKCALFAMCAMENVHTHTYTHKLRRRCFYSRRRFSSASASITLLLRYPLVVTLMIPNGQCSLSPSAQMFFQMRSSPRRPSGLTYQMNVCLKMIFCRPKFVFSSAEAFTLNSELDSYGLIPSCSSLCRKHS